MLASIILLGLTLVVLMLPVVTVGQKEEEAFVFTDCLSDLPQQTGNLTRNDYAEFAKQYINGIGCDAEAVSELSWHTCWNILACVCNESNGPDDEDGACCLLDAAHVNLIDPNVQNKICLVTRICADCAVTAPPTASPTEAPSSGGSGISSFHRLYSWAFMGAMLVSTSWWITW